MSSGSFPVPSLEPKFVVPKKISGRGVPTATAVPYRGGYWYSTINAITQFADSSRCNPNIVLIVRLFGLAEVRHSSAQVTDYPTDWALGTGYAGCIGVICNKRISQQSAPVKRTTLIRCI